MSSDIITIDFDTVIPREDLPAIEAEANAAVWADLPVKCWYPAEEELPNVPYRTKRALPWPVRIVEMPGIDSCACCGTHVQRTGEIGLIKLFSAVKFRSGTRMEMACGSIALEMLNKVWEQNKLVSQAFSAQMGETGAAAQRMNETVESLKYRITGLENRIFGAVADGYAGKERAVHFEADLDNTAVRVLADAIADKVTDFAAVFSGSDENGYAFCLVSRSNDLRQLGKEMTRALEGRGGGKPQFQQGRVSASRTAIETFFK
jgi:alanyl-tRNA synthetase